MITTITSKGQVTIPKAVRDLLKVKAGDQVDFTIDKDGSVRLLVVGASISRLKGMAPKPEKAVTIAEMQAAIETE